MSMSENEPKRVIWGVVAFILMIWVLVVSLCLFSIYNHYREESTPRGSTMMQPINSNSSIYPNSVQNRKDVGNQFQFCWETFIPKIPILDQFSCDMKDYACKSFNEILFYVEILPQACPEPKPARFYAFHAKVDEYIRLTLVDSYEYIWNCPESKLRVHLPTMESPYASIFSSLISGIPLRMAKSMHLSLRLNGGVIQEFRWMDSCKVISSKDVSFYENQLGGVGNVACEMDLRYPCMPYYMESLNDVRGTCATKDGELYDPTSQNQQKKLDLDVRLMIGWYGTDLLSSPLRSTQHYFSNYKNFRRRYNDNFFEKLLNVKEK